MCKPPPAAEAARRGVQRVNGGVSFITAAAEPLLCDHRCQFQGASRARSLVEKALQGGSFHTRKEDIKAILNPLFSHPSERSLNSSFTRSSDVADRTCFPLNCPRE